MSWNTVNAVTKCKWSNNHFKVELEFHENIFRWQVIQKFKGKLSIFCGYWKRLSMVASKHILWGMLVIWIFTLVLTFSLLELQVWWKTAMLASQHNGCKLFEFSFRFWHFHYWNYVQVWGKNSKIFDIKWRIGISK